VNLELTQRSGVIEIFLYTFKEFIMNWYLKALRQYADFGGRARRKEYWMFTLFNIIFSILAMIIDNAAGLTIGDDYDSGIFQLIYGLAIFIPTLSVWARRLHDVGKSSKMFLVLIIPLIGVIWHLILVTRNSDPYENEYGPNPKDGTMDYKRSS